MTRCNGSGFADGPPICLHPAIARVGVKSTCDCWPGTPSEAVVDFCDVHLAAARTAVCTRCGTQMAISEPVEIR
jgi:hypothetical protein